jgi:hypothetical protein
MKLILFKSAANCLMAIATASKLIPSPKLRNQVADKLESTYVDLVNWYQS